MVALVIGRPVEPETDPLTAKLRAKAAMGSSARAMMRSSALVRIRACAGWLT